MDFPFSSLFLAPAPSFKVSFQVNSSLAYCSPTVSTGQQQRWAILDRWLHLSVPQTRGKHLCMGVQRLTSGSVPRPGLGACSSNLRMSLTFGLSEALESSRSGFRLSKVQKQQKWNQWLTKSGPVKVYCANTKKKKRFANQERSTETWTQARACAVTKRLT